MVDKMAGLSGEVGEFAEVGILASPFSQWVQLEYNEGREGGRGPGKVVKGSARCVCGGGSMGGYRCPVG